MSICSHTVGSQTVTEASSLAAISTQLEVPSCVPPFPTPGPTVIPHTGPLPVRIVFTSNPLSPTQDHTLMVPSREQEATCSSPAEMVGRKHTPVTSAAC
eukprot:1046160-Rhodomonas_salina.2